MCDVCATLPEWMTAPPAAESRKRKQKRATMQTLESQSSGLADHMREWRRTVAKGNGVPAYVILHDSTLEEICRRRPASIGDLLEIPGIGARKAETYGREILSVLAAFAGPRAAT